MYVDDRLVDVSGGVPRVQNEAPPSDHVFVGRSLADNRLTADVEVDDLQVCSDDLEQLIATGDYVGELDGPQHWALRGRGGTVEREGRMTVLLLSCNG